MDKIIRTKIKIVLTIIVFGLAVIMMSGVSFGTTVTVNSLWEEVNIGTKHYDVYCTEYGTDFKSGEYNIIKQYTINGCTVEDKEGNEIDDATTKTSILQRAYILAQNDDTISESKMKSIVDGWNKDCNKAVRLHIYNDLYNLTSTNQTAIWMVNNNR